MLGDNCTNYGVVQGGSDSSYSLEKLQVEVTTLRLQDRCLVPEDVRKKSFAIMMYDVSFNGSSSSLAMSKHNVVRQ